MSVAAFLFSLFQAVAAIPKIGDQIRDFAAQVAAWYINQATEATKSKIVDAAVFAAHASNEDERYEAAQKWRDALSRARVS